MRQPNLIGFDNGDFDLDVMEMYQYDEHLSSWWKFIIVIKFHCDGISWSYWKFIILIKIHLCDENLSLWWKLDIMSKIHHFDEIHPCDENSSPGIMICHGDENISHMKLIVGMKFFTWVHIYNYEFSSHWPKVITIICSPR